MDLLDISLGATSISNATQNSDPWSIPAPHDASSRSTHVDPWQSTSNGGAIAKQPMPSAGGHVDGWLPRTHSPSVASGSSNEGWLQNNGVSNGNLVGNIAAASDPWLTKAPKQAVVPDPWLNNATHSVSDAWQPTSQANEKHTASAVS